MRETTLYKRVLLCIPPFLGIHGWPACPHVGIGYLSEFLSFNGIENDVMDMRLGYTVKDLRRKIREFNPDLIGFTMVTYWHDIAYKIIEQIQSPKYEIVVGGPHVSTMRQKVLMDCKADFGVKLEGEYTLLELCRGKPWRDIEGLIYGDMGDIIENENRPFIENLDDIPFPRYEKFELDSYGTRVISIASSRGCPYGCVYCPIKVTMGRKYRARSAKNVASEIEYWYQRGYRKFDFVDDNFTLYKDRIYELCDLIEELKLKGIILECGNGIRADCVDRNLLERMREVGFRYLAFGVESGNDRVLRSINKGTDTHTIEQTIKNACKLGYEIGLFFMIGNLEETASDVEDSFRLALKYPIEHANFYNVIPFPGTYLHDQVVKNNYSVGNLDYRLSRFQHLDLEPFFETPKFSLKERRESLIKSRKVMAEILKRASRRKLEKLSVSQRLLRYAYGFLNDLINYLFVWSWLLTHIRNRTVRKILILFGMKLMDMFGRTKPK